MDLKKKELFKSIALELSWCCNQLSLAEIAIKSKSVHNQIAEYSGSSWECSQAIKVPVTGGSAGLRCDRTAAIWNITHGESLEEWDAAEQLRQSRSVVLQLWCGRIKVTLPDAFVRPRSTTLECTAKTRLTFTQITSPWLKCQIQTSDSHFFFY